MRELNLVKTGHLEWRDREEPRLLEPRGAIVRPFVASRCDGDALPIHPHVSRAMQVGMHVGQVDPALRRSHDEARPAS